MKKIYILYGLPASGKQTIAELLSKEFSLELYYHHLAFDKALLKYKKHSKEFKSYYKELYLGNLDSILKTKSLITTLNYHHKKKEKLEDIRKVAKRNNAKIIFLNIKTNLDNMYKRVVLPKRNSNAKMLTINELKDYLKYVKMEKIKEEFNEEHFIFNTNNISEQEVLENIKDKNII